MVEDNQLSATNIQNKNRDEVENTYQFLFDENPSLLFMINYDRRIQDVNNKTCLFSGYDKDELTGEDPLDFIHPISRINFSNIIDQLFNKEKVTDTETDFICKDGRIRRILFSSGRLLKFNNKMSVLISGIDITENRKKLEDFEENSEMFTKFMNHLPVGVFIKDSKNTCVFRNRFMSDHFDPDIISSIPSDKSDSELSISRFIRLKNKRGKELYCELTVFQFTTKNDIRFNGGILADMTDRIEAEEAQKEYCVENCKSILGRIPDNIYLIEQTGKIIDYTGSEQVYDNPVFLADIFPEDTAEEIMKTVIVCIASGKMGTMHYTLTKDGQEKVYEARFVRYNNDSVISINRNITGEPFHKILDETESDSSREKLFTIIAHDLRSPFHGLLGLSEILANEVQDLTSAEIKKIGEELHTTFKNQYRLLENLLAWSLIQRNKIEVKTEPVKLTDAVQESIKVISWTARRKQIKLLNLVDNKVVVSYDPNLLSSVLQNLLTNAIKFSEEQSEVTIKFIIKDGVRSLEIHDEGIGVSEKEIERIMGNDAAFTKKGTADEPGTGLGLIICREFIEKHGGKFYIKSKKGQGTTVGFTFKD